MGPAGRPIMIDDKIKYQQMIDCLKSVTGNSTFAILTSFSENIRSYYGFTCWLAIRVASHGSGVVTDQSYLIDAIKLRAHLRGESDHHEGIDQAIFSNNNICKIFIGQSSFL